MKIPPKVALGNGKTRDMRPDDQPCDQTDCISCEGFCRKRFYSGVKPPGYGTSKCPGKVKRPTVKNAVPTSLGFRPKKPLKPKKHRTGTQSRLGGEG